MALMLIIASIGVVVFSIIKKKKSQEETALIEAAISEREKYNNQFIANPPDIVQDDLQKPMPDLVIAQAIPASTTTPYSMPAVPTVPPNAISVNIPLTLTDRRVVANKQAAERLSRGNQKCPEYDVSTGKIEFRGITFSATDMLGCGLYGRVFLGLLNVAGKSSNVVIKFAANHRNIANEISLPIKLLQAVEQNICPHFVMQHDYSQCEENPCVLNKVMTAVPEKFLEDCQYPNPCPKFFGAVTYHHIFVYEFLAGMSIDKFMRQGSYQNRTLACLLCQALLTLVTLNQHMRLCHDDAHWNNWFVRQGSTSSNQCWQYKVYGQDVYLPNTGCEIVLLDYGRLAPMKSGYETVDIERTLKWSSWASKSKYQVSPEIEVFFHSVNIKCNGDHAKPKDLLFFALDQLKSPQLGAWDASSSNGQSVNDPVFDLYPSYSALDKS